MAGLVSYESSSEDEADRQQTQSQQVNPNGKILNFENVNPPKAEAPPASPALPAALPSMEAFVGPMLAPSGSTALDLPEPDQDLELPMPPGSPYTSTRALLRDLTLPTHPNLDLPPSPPGSPPPSLTRKVESFLELKDKGIHFNAKLESSSALRNPALLDKLLAFTGLDDTASGGGAQYATTLPKDLWDPGALPEWAHRQELRAAQERLRKEREAERAATGRVDFVPASGGAAVPAKSGPGGLSKRRRLE
ncbi:hypothetical protein jhhlp_007288 [Lomentospora prolificans]|uniref:HCNGP-like protein n=1 Tax=Lomentospora prolificans TaxID=41688 RepID=A0A2N3N288_9PEZI|nr:hypothetical protein jhhlp_007288 [Lomentospora prolificans]